MYNVVEMRNMNNKKGLLIKLIDQLEDEKIQALIEVVKAMIYPSYDEENFSEIEEKRFKKLVEDYNESKFVEVDNFDD